MCVSRGSRHWQKLKRVESLELFEVTVEGNSTLLSSVLSVMSRV
jgi:hypothetical protein